MILDAGVLISSERHEHLVTRALSAFERAGTPLRTTESVVAQVWRGSPHQARLARFLATVEVHPLLDGRSVGLLLGEAGTSDVVDAHLVLLAVELGEPVLTGDPGDLNRIADVLGRARPTIHAWP